MSGFFLKKLLFATLSVNVLLVIVNLFLGSSSSENSDADAEFRPPDAAALFFDALSDYKLPDTLVVPHKRKNTGDDTLSTYHSVYLPADIHFPELLKSIQERVLPAGYTVKTESETGNKFDVIISLGKKKYFHVKFHITPTAHRKAGSVAFFVFIKPNTNVNIAELNYLPRGFFPVIECNKATLGLHQQLIDGNGGYGVYLDDNFADIDFRLDFSFSSQRFSTALRNIFTFFSGMKFVLISQNANYYLPSTLEKINSYSAAKNTSVFGTGIMVDLRNADNSVVLDEVELLTSKLSFDDNAFFLIDDYTYLKHEKKLLNLRKKGLKMLNIGQLNKKASLNAMLLK